MADPLPRISIQLPPDVLVALTAEANDAERSVSWMARKYIKDGLRRAGAAVDSAEPDADDEPVQP